MKKLLMMIVLSSYFSAQSLASSLPDFTHNTLLELEPVSHSSFKVAGIYWLPDYLGKNMDNNGRVNDHNNDNGGGDKNKSCADYGFQACEAPKTLKPGARPVHPVQGLDCYKTADCICPAEYKYTDDNCFKVINGTKKTATGPDKCNDKSNTCLEDTSFKYFFFNHDTQCYNKTDCSGCPDNSVAVSDPQNMWVNSLDIKMRVKNCRCKESSYPHETEIANATCKSFCTNSEGKTTYSCICNDGYICSNGAAASCSAECIRDCPQPVTCQVGQKEIKSTKSTCKDVTVECCPTPVGTCDYGCLSYSNISGCTDICTQCNDKPLECTLGTVDYNANWCGGSLSCFMPNSSKQTCVILPSCSTLGYTNNISDCSDHKVIKCPYDTSYVFCYR